MKRLLPLAAGLLAAMTMPARAETVLSVTQTSYDALDRPVCVAVRMNPSTYGSLPVDTTPAPGGAPISDAACKLAAASAAYGNDRITRNVYDTAGQLVQVIQGYQQDLSVHTPPVPADERAYATYVYGGDGEVLDTVDAQGNRTHMQYDGFNRLVELDYPSPTLPSPPYDPSFPTTTALNDGGHLQHRRLRCHARSRLRTLYLRSQQQQTDGPQT
ncbi:MAG: hypothetical protein WDN06_16225 [Asticcacaulis sp.]